MDKKKDRKARSRFCEVWTFTCGKSSTKGHYTKNCSKCTTCGEWGHRDSSSRACCHGKGFRSPSHPHVSKGSPKNSDHDNAGYVYDQLCVTSEQNTLANNSTKAVALMKQQPSAPPIVHHIYDGKWVARPSKPHPMILVRITPLPEEHALFGHPMKDTSKFKPATVSMVADTGCQSTIIPLQTAHSLGIQTKDLVPA